LLLLNVVFHGRLPVGWRGGERQDVGLVIKRSPVQTLVGVRRRNDSGQVVHIHIHRAVLILGRRGPTAGRVTVGSAEVSVVAATARCALVHMTTITRKLLT